MDSLPKWVKAEGTPERLTINGYVCDDPRAQAFALCCALYGFNLPAFDSWLDELGECGARKELAQRRALAEQAMRSNHDDALRRHLEWMLLRRQLVKREDFLLPAARRDATMQSGRKRGNVKGAETAKAKAKDWQSECVKRAKSLLATGRQKHELAGMLAPKFDRDKGTIRRVLKKAGVH